MNIEVLLTEAEIANEFTEALEARDLPEKFFYWLPLSVKRWRELASDGFNIELQNTWTAVSGRVHRHMNHFGNEVPVISFGAGDGAKDRLLLKSIQRNGKAPKYYPVDASQALLESACAAVEDDEIDAMGVKADISSRMHMLLAADVAEAPRLFLMAGNTLGGFDPLEQIKNLADALRAGDCLIIDGELTSPSSLQAAESENVRDFSFAPLASVGVLPEDGRIRFEQKSDSRHKGLCLVTKHFLADRDLRITISAKDILLARGERIFMNFRYLYTPEAFTWLLQEYGELKIEEQIYSPDGNYVAAICSK